VNRKAVDHAKALVKSLGKERALKVSEECENFALSAGGITYFNEADFNVNEKGHYELSKYQSGKLTKNKTRRVSKTKSFWRDVVIAIKKEQV